MDAIYLFLALLIALLWGSQPALHKDLLTRYHWSTIITLSAVLYFACILVLFALYAEPIWKDVAKIRAHDALLIIFLVICTTFLTSVLYYVVLKKHSSSIVSALIYSAPVFTFVIAYLFLKERLTPVATLGIALVIMGILCIAYNEQ